jgi:hypothetical protein
MASIAALTSSRLQRCPRHCTFQEVNNSLINIRTKVDDERKMLMGLQAFQYHHLPCAGGVDKPIQ